MEQTENQGGPSSRLPQGSEAGRFPALTSRRCSAEPVVTSQSPAALRPRLAESRSQLCSCHTGPSLRDCIRCPSGSLSQGCGQPQAEDGSDWLVLRLRHEWVWSQGLRLLQGAWGPEHAQNDLAWGQQPRATCFQTGLADSFKALLLYALQAKEGDIHLSHTYFLPPTGGGSSLAVGDHEAGRC